MVGRKLAEKRAKEAQARLNETISKLRSTHAAIEKGVAESFGWEEPDADDKWMWWARRFKFATEEDGELNFAQMGKTQDLLDELSVKYVRRHTTVHLFSSLDDLDKEHTPAQLGNVIRQTTPRTRYARSTGEEPIEVPEGIGAGSAGDD